MTCVATSAVATDVLVEVLRVIVPEACVEPASLDLQRDAPDADCVVAAVGPMVASAEPVVRDLRARGYANAIIMVADEPTMLAHPPLKLLGVQSILATDALATTIPAALLDVLEMQERVRASAQGLRVLASLRRLQGVIAAGQLAARLQHRLNNPLAALLAEAQLLELEPLAPEHATSVRRIIELCRRVIGETRSIEGLAHAGDAPQT